MTKDEQTKEVYAHFGAAFALANTLEEGLCCYLVAQRVLTDPDVTDENFDAVEKAIHGDTLGPVVGKVKAVAKLDPKDKALLKEALDQRNFLAHHYFRARAFTIESDQGRADMIRELRGIHDVFKRAIVVADELLQTARKATGISDQELEEALARMRREAENE
jgi:hypothetical protein